MQTTMSREAAVPYPPRLLHRIATCGRLLVVLVFAINPYFKSFGADSASPSNILIILTDDQGYGDLSYHGNPKLATPHTDRLAHESVALQQFYVSPVCAPTRASLITGRYNYRTGAIDTYLGRAMMHPDEVTLAEMLSAAGYRTGIFGKWHLGDNYPLRPQDQGFDEVLVHRGGGIGQPSDPPGGSSYFDPVLEHNGQAVKLEGYCSDIFTDAAIRFLRESDEQPFFVYLSFNCPHTPLQIADEYADPFRAMNLEHSEFPAVGQPLPGKADQETIARVYGMVKNIDDNIGRLLDALDEANLSDDTIVVFFTDNGPQQVRYNAGLRGRKGSVYDGGIRVPCFVRWPARLEPRKVDRIAAHIDLAPTLLAACGVEPPSDVAFDGRSLLPLLTGQPADWPDRALFFQWHRGDEPELYRAFAVRTQQYKLVQPVGAGHQAFDAAARPELYDMVADPYEMHDLADREPQVAARLLAAYEAWFRDVSATRGYEPVRIHVGTPHENPLTLTRQDWRGPRAGWAEGDLGYWEIEVAVAGTYDVTLRFPPAAEPMTARLAIGDTAIEEDIASDAERCTFRRVELTRGPARLIAELDDGETTAGSHYVDIERVR